MVLLCTKSLITEQMIPYGMHHQVRSTEIVDDALKLLPFNAKHVIKLKSNAII